MSSNKYDCDDLQEQVYSAQLFGFTVDEFMMGLGNGVPVNDSGKYLNFHHAVHYHWYIVYFLPGPDDRRNIPPEISEYHLEAVSMLSELLVKGLVKEEVSNHIEFMGNFMIKKYTNDETEIALVKDIVKQLIDQYLSSSAEPLNMLEAQMKDVFRIPPHVLLPGDEVQRTQYSPEDEKEADEHFKNLLNRVKRTKAFDIELRQELKVLRDALPILTKHVQECETMATACQEADLLYQQMEPIIDQAIESKLQLLNLNKDT